MQFRKPARLQGRLGSQEVCLALASSLACLTIERDAIRWPARSRKRRKTRRENRSEIGPGTGAGAPKIDSKSCRDLPGTPRGAQERPGSVSGASRGVPGTPRAQRPESPQRHPGTPKRTPGSATRRPKSTPSRTRERQKIEFSRAARSRSIVGAMFRRCWSIFGFSAKSVNP